MAAVNKQTTPLQLHLFNNCFDNQYSDRKFHHLTHNFPSIMPWWFLFSAELIWKVARYTSAAPMFFSEFENYVDGGVLANNPSEVGLTEIQDFHLQRGEKLPISLVVSVGTGVYPVENLGSIDARQYMYMGKHWLKFKNSFNRLGNLIQLLSNAVSTTWYGTKLQSCFGQICVLTWPIPKVFYYVPFGSTLSSWNN